MVCSSGKTQLSYVAYNGVSTTYCDLVGNKLPHSQPMELIFT